MTVYSDGFKKFIIENGPYCTFKTLLGGNPDRNRRFIRDLRDESTVATYNVDMMPWTPADEAAMNARCKALNAQFLYDEYYAVWK